MSLVGRTLWPPTPSSMRSVTRGVKRAAQYVSPYVANIVARNAGEYVSKKIKNSMGSSSGGRGGATTAAFPTYKKRFRRKRISKKKKRFIRSVRRVISGQTAYQTIVRNPHISSPLTMTYAANKQGVQCVSMFGINGTAGVHDDVKTFFLNTYNASAGAQGPSTMRDEAYIYCYNASLNLNIINSSPTQVVDLDIYHIVCKRDVNLAQITSGNQDIGQFYNLCMQNTANYNVNQTALLQPDMPGTNPFTNPVFSKYFKVKSKQKLFLKASESADVNINFKKYKRLSGKDVDTIPGTSNLLAKAGLTEALLFIGNNVNWTENTGTPLAIYVTKRYKIKNNSGAQAPSIGLG